MKTPIPTTCSHPNVLDITSLAHRNDIPLLLRKQGIAAIGAEIKNPSSAPGL
jgi:hypothetical protein